MIGIVLDFQDDRNLSVFFCLEPVYLPYLLTLTFLILTIICALWSDVP